MEIIDLNISTIFFRVPAFFSEEIPRLPPPQKKHKLNIFVILNQIRLKKYEND